MLNAVVMKEIKEWTVSILVAVALALVIRYFVIELYVVDGPSMKPTLHNGDRLVVNKFLYRFRAPSHDDIIVFKFPGDQRRDFIKRVIAVPGDTIEINDSKVFVNGNQLKESYILDKTRGSYTLATVPNDHVFVLGDNRNNSEDSRFRDVGFVPYELIKGKAMVVFWPFADMKSLP